MRCVPRHTCGQPETGDLTEECFDVPTTGDQIKGTAATAASDGVAVTYIWTCGGCRDGLAIAA